MHVIAETALNGIVYLGEISELEFSMGRMPPRIEKRANRYRLLSIAVLEEGRVVSRVDLTL